MNVLRNLIQTITTTDEFATGDEVIELDDSMLEVLAAYEVPFSGALEGQHAVRYPLVFSVQS